MKIFRDQREELRRKQQMELEESKEYQEQMKIIQDKLELSKIHVDNESDEDDLLNFDVEIGSNNSEKLKKKSVKINLDPTPKKNKKLISRYNAKNIPKNYKTKQTIDSDQDDRLYNSDIVHKIIKIEHNVGADLKNYGWSNRSASVDQNLKNKYNFDQNQSAYNEDAIKHSYMTLYNGFKLAESMD